MQSQMSNALLGVHVGRRIALLVGTCQGETGVLAAIVECKFLDDSLIEARHVFL